MKKPRLTNRVLEGLRIAIVHANSVVDPDLDTHGDDVPDLEAAERWVRDMHAYRANRPEATRKDGTR